MKYNDLVPFTTGYWCPAMVNNGAVYVMTYDNDAPVVYKFDLEEMNW